MSHSLSEAASQESRSSAPSLRNTRDLPSWIETLLTLLVVAALLPAFLALEGVSPDRDGRFTNASLVVGGLPPPVLPALCERYGAQVESEVRERLCRGERSGQGNALQDLPAELRTGLQRTREAFLAPLRRAQTQLTALRLQQHEGVGDLRLLGQEIEALESGVRPFVTLYEIDPAASRGPLPLHCAHLSVEAALRRPMTPAAAQDGSEMARANAVLLLAGALQGATATGSLAASALLPAPAAALPANCGTSLAESLDEAARMMALAREARADAAKNTAMRELLQTAGWQWGSWMLLGLGFVKLSRRASSTSAALALALTAWGVLAWIGRVPWPLVGDRVFHPARRSGEWWGAEAQYVLWMLGLALVLGLLSLRGRRPVLPRRQTLASRIGYPGLAMMTGIGWVLLLDLSAHGHLANRYLALYHQGHLWLGMLVMTVLLLMRQRLARGWAWSLSVVDELAALATRRLAGRGGRLLLPGLALAGVLLVSLLLSNLRQLTSELGRLWLIAGAAWFFFLRGGPLAERLASAPGVAGSLWRYLSPLLFVVVVLGVAMLATRDFGPLLIAAYGAGAFLAASLAMWWYQRGGTRLGASLLAASMFALWILALTVGLLQLGGLESTTATRLESLAAPLASANDQLALLRWFQEATPAGGFGVGNVPWCGYGSGSRCAGVPAQIHSDYTLTAMIGAFGPYAAAAITLACALWLHRLVRHHGRVTRGEPRLVRHSEGLGNEDQAFLSWLCVAWVVLTLCQLAVTVAGNLAVLPLTGVTYPFASFGLTSLLVNMGFLGLCLNLDVGSETGRG